MYHAILIDQQFVCSQFIKSQEVFAEKHDGSWRIYGVIVSDTKVSEFIHQTQEYMKAGTWYAHIYNDKELIIIFKQKVFRVSKPIDNFEEILEYGRQLGIPSEQLDFYPSTFEEEAKYFKKLTEM